MSETAKNIRSISRENILVPVTDKGFSKEDIKLSAILRIADALEIISTAPANLSPELKKLKEQNQILIKEVDSKNRKAARFQSLYNKLKKSLHV